MSMTLFNRTVMRAQTSSTFRRPLTLLCLYLLFDYLRIHDIIPIDHPEWFSKAFATWYRWLLPTLARSVACPVRSAATAVLYDQDRAHRHRARGGHPRR